MTPQPFIPGWLYEQGFSPAQRDVICFVARRLPGPCFDNKATMAKTLGMGREKLRRTLAELVQYQWLKKTARAQADVYELSIPGIRMDKVKEHNPSVNLNARKPYLGRSRKPCLGLRSKQVSKNIDTRGEAFALTYALRQEIGSAYD